MSENEMDNRGSKSVSGLYNSTSHKSGTVKEQRVDGSLCILRINKMHIRYTLMGFERNYQVKIPSNHLFKARYSTLSILNHKNLINPWFLTGFADA